MHILIIPSWYPENPEDPDGSFFREQSLALHERGHNVGVIAPRLISVTQPGKFKFALRGITEANDQGMPTYRLSTINFTPRMPKFYFKTMERMTEKLFAHYVNKHGLPDIIHLHSIIRAGTGALKVAEKYNIPLIYLEHHTGFAEGTFEKYILSIARDVAISSAANFAVGSSTAKILDDILDLPENNFGVMPNSVSDIFLNHPLEKKSTSHFTFSHVSFLCKRKRVDIILQAFATHFRGKQNLSLVIGGDGPDRHRLEELSKELGVAEQVQFTGMLNRMQVRDLMAKADAFLLASDFETFGVVLVEAMAIGLPLIATRSNGPEDIITPGTGYLVEQGDVIGFGNAMQNLVENRDNWKPEHLRQSCASRFSSDVLVSKWEEIYRDALSIKANIHD